MDDTEKAKKIVEEILYITIASVSEDGKPWNTPVYAAYDENYNFFWTSDQNGQHSKNIRANPDVALVIYDSTVSEGSGQGVYIQGKAYEISEEKDIAHAIKYIYSRKNKSLRTVKEFLGDYPRRVYKCIPEKFWVNGSGEVNGNFIDIKIEINLKANN